MTACTIHARRYIEMHEDMCRSMIIIQFLYNIIMIGISMHSPKFLSRGIQNGSKSTGSTYTTVQYVPYKYMI